MDKKQIMLTSLQVKLIYTFEEKQMFQQMLGSLVFAAPIQITHITKSLLFYFEKKGFPKLRNEKSMTEEEFRALDYDLFFQSA